MVRKWQDHQLRSPSGELELEDPSLSESEQLIRNPCGLSVVCRFHMKRAESV